MALGVIQHQWRELFNNFPSIPLKWLRCIEINHFSILSRFFKISSQFSTNLSLENRKVFSIHQNNIIKAPTSTCDSHLENYKEDWWCSLYCGKSTNVQSFFLLSSLEKHVEIFFLFSLHFMVFQIEFHLYGVHTFSLQEFHSFIEHIRSLMQRWFYERQNCQSTSTSTYLKCVEDYRERV